MKSSNPLLPLLFAALVFAGCGGESVDPGNDVAAGQGVFGGEIGESDFEIVLETAIGPQFPLQGPFVLRGHNLRYDGALGALVCDLSILNQGTVAHPEPVGLTFIQLLPQGVTVLNPDNGVQGEGAAIEFAFDNNDGVWTPGEQSLPRETRFGVAPRTSIAFVGRLDIGMGPGGGSIGGVVWHDEDRDGDIDPGERGLAGALVILETTGSREPAAVPDMRWHTRTAHDGSYRFDGLAPGHYVVGNGFDPPCEPTTPSPLHVLLAEDSTGVSDFLMANFGCIPIVIPPDSLVDVGDYVIARGHFTRGPIGALVAQSLLVNPRCDTTVIDTLGGPRCPRVNILRGPVTGIDRPNSVLEIMGSRMLFRPNEIAAPGLGLENINIGDRIEALIIVGQEPATATGVAWDRVAVLLNRWPGLFDEAHGVVDELLLAKTSPGLIAFRVLGVTVHVGQVLVQP